MMSVHWVMPGPVLPNAGCAIITASRVAARRRHLAGCQTHWGPPSNSSHQNKGSVRSADSCNISPGTGSHTISQNTCREIFLLFNNTFWGYCLQSCCCWSNVKETVFRCASCELNLAAKQICLLIKFFFFSFSIQYTGSGKRFSVWG